MSILFACGLMSKPMLVTVPFVLLLLDYWPLDRARGHKSEGRDQKEEVSLPRRSLGEGGWSVVSGLVMEKIPLFALSAASCMATVVAHTGATGGSEPLPLMWRINNTVVSYATYVWQMIWPSRLAVAYPTNPLPDWQVIIAIAFFIVVSAIAICARRSRPYIFTGWFWYLGMLVPVIGIFQIGWQSHADRYTYLPQIGLYVLVTWAVADIWKTLNAQRSTFNVQFRSGNSALGVGHWVFGVVYHHYRRPCLAPWDQTKFWKNTETLWTHTLAVTSNNDIAHHNFGLYLIGRGRIDEAISHYEAALKIRSGAEEARYNLTAALVHNNLGAALVRKGRIDDAIAHYRKAIELRPDYADGHFNLGSVMLQQGRIDEAIDEWRKTLSIHPGDSEVHDTLGDALMQKHQITEAISHYQAALKIDPNSFLTLNRLAWIRSTSPDASLRNGAEAMELAQKADKYSGGKNPIVIRSLAAAYAEAGRFDDAIKTIERALEVADSIGEHRLANTLERDVELYRANVPLRDFNLTNVQPSE